MMNTKQRLSAASVFITFALDTFGIGIVYPIFTPLFLNIQRHFFAEDAGLFIRVVFLGILVALFPLSQFFSAPLIGDFSDRVGRKKALFFTIAGSIVGYIITAVSIAKQSLLLLLISRFISGVFAGNSTICLAAISDTTASSQERSKKFGYISACGGLSFFCAVLVGGFFSDPRINNLFSPSLPFLITASLFLCNLLLVWLFFEETHKVPKNQRFHLFKGVHHILEAIKSPSLKNCYMVFFFFVAAWMSAMQFFPTILLHSYAASQRELTINFLGIGLLWSFSNFFIQRSLTPFFSPKKILYGTIPLLTLLLLSCFLGQSYPSYLIHFGLAAIAAALTWSNALAHVSLHANAEAQGAILGINQSFGSIASIVGALMGGLTAAIHPKLTLIFSALLCFFSLIYLRKPSKSLS